MRHHGKGDRELRGKKKKKKIVTKARRCYYDNYITNLFLMQENSFCRDKREKEQALVCKPGSHPGLQTS